MTEVPRWWSPAGTTAPGGDFSSGRVRSGYPWAEVRVVDEHDVPGAARRDPASSSSVPGHRGRWNAGYHKMPEDTARAWRDGWLHTGDAFRQDEDGRFSLRRPRQGRDPAPRRGNISSFEVESFVLTTRRSASAPRSRCPAPWAGTR
ncbi:hypothetical protein ACU686_14775 [Yinghuangia aomiensis]